MWYVSFLSRYCVCSSAGQVSKVPASVFFGYVGHNKYWRGSEVSETALIIQTQSVCVCVDCAGHFVVSGVYFYWFHEDSSSSVRPALFSELGFRVYHRWGVGKWNSKTEIENRGKKRHIHVHACCCVSKLKAILFVCVCYFDSQVLWINPTNLGDTG